MLRPSTPSRKRSRWPRPVRCTCEVCGRPGVLYARATGSRRSAPITPRRTGAGRARFENLHIVQTFNADRILPSLHRETDSFVDVDPKSLGIEEED